MPLTCRNALQKASRIFTDEGKIRHALFLSKWAVEAAIEKLLKDSDLDTAYSSFEGSRLGSTASLGFKQSSGAGNNPDSFGSSFHNSEEYGQVVVGLRAISSHDSIHNPPITEIRRQLISSHGCGDPNKAFRALMEKFQASELLIQSLIHFPARKYKMLFVLQAFFLQKPRRWN